MVSRSSLAARREARGSSIGSNTLRSFAAGRGSKTGSSSNIGGAGGDTEGAAEALRLVSAVVSLMFRASWIAERATSVGSLTFLGVFAMFSPSPRYLYTPPRALRAPQAHRSDHAAYADHLAVP